MWGYVETRILLTLLRLSRHTPAAGECILREERGGRGGGGGGDRKGTFIIERGEGSFKGREERRGGRELGDERGEGGRGEGERWRRWGGGGGGWGGGGQEVGRGG